MADPVAVNSMFGRIAHRYDLANRVLSWGIDTYWRSRLVATVRGWRPRNVLDLATGSGDVAFALARALRPEVGVFGLDFCEPMLERAETRKARGPRRYSRVEFLFGDALDIPVEEASFDAVTIAFGLRNIANRTRCFSEIRRILRPEGRMFILEFSRPWRIVRPAYSFYRSQVVPRVAGVITGNTAAYKYLSDTIAGFPDSATLSAEIAEAGFGDVSVRKMTMGIVSLHSARRQPRLS